MAELLVSVRSAKEAAAALAGGAAVIDVKEPDLGSLGRADDRVIAEVVALAGGKRPISAACGELLGEQRPYVGPGLTFVKWGLAGCGRRPDWPGIFANRRSLFSGQTVYVAYADWQCAQAPPVEEVAALAMGDPGSVLLLDTCCKDAATLGRERRPTLLDWLERDEIIALCRRCRLAGVRVALAGSLGLSEIEALLPVQPAWFAVRGAACAYGDRRGAIDAGKVRELAELCGVSMGACEVTSAPERVQNSVLP